jgi:hypothetical protein
MLGLTHAFYQQEDIGEAAALVETLRPAFQVAIDNAAAGPQAHAVA